MDILSDDSFVKPCEDQPLPSQPSFSPFSSKGISTTRILNLDSTKEELTCACCLMIVWDAVCCGSCEAHFCNICILQWLQRHQSSLCPTCQCEFDSHPIPRISRNLLSRLKISCINEKNGCKNPIDYANLYTHQDTCEFRLETCQNKDCGFEMPIFELKIHKDICPHLIVSCQHCKEFMKNRDKEAHEIECPYRRILCCYENCGQSLIAMDYDGHLNECNFKPLMCEFCNKEVIKKDIEAHDLICEEKPVKCSGCGFDLKLKLLTIHENECEFIEISCETCEKRFTRKEAISHDRMTCFESAVKMLKSVLEIHHFNKDKGDSMVNYKPFSQNNRIDLLTKRLESQASEIQALKKELISLQMANLTDSKLNVYSLKYPDLSHKSLFLTNWKTNQLSSQKQLPFHDLALNRSKMISLLLPDNISIKKHNVLSLCSLNESLVIIGDDIGRLVLYDLTENQELASITINGSLEIKALALFAYDSAASLKELYTFKPSLQKNSDDKSSLSLIGFWIVSGHGSGDIFIWDIEFSSDSLDKTVVFKKVSQMAIVSHNKISSIIDLEDQTHFITASYGKNNQIEIWDCMADMRVCSIDRPHKDTISKLAIIEKKTRFISASDDGTLRVWRVMRTQMKIQSPKCEKTIVLNEPIWSLAVLPRNRVVVALNNMNIEIYDLGTKELMIKAEEIEENEGGLIGDLLVIGCEEDIKEMEEEEEKDEKDENNEKNQKYDKNNENKGEKDGKNKEEIDNKKFFIVALHKDRIAVYDGNLKQILKMKQNENEFKWGFLASHLLQVLVGRRTDRKEKDGNIVKLAVLGQKSKKISVLELTFF